MADGEAEGAADGLPLPGVPFGLPAPAETLSGCEALLLPHAVRAPRAAVAAEALSTVLREMLLMVSPARSSRWPRGRAEATRIITAFDQIF
ncbi:hypothetical protein GCM10010442_28390 [Kitasatospora kifunensis]